MYVGFMDCRVQMLSLDILGVQGESGLGPGAFSPTWYLGLRV